MTCEQLQHNILRVKLRSVFSPQVQLGKIIHVFVTQHSKTLNKLEEISLGATIYSGE